MYNFCEEKGILLRNSASNNDIKKKNDIEINRRKQTLRSFFNSSHNVSNDNKKYKHK